MIKLRVEGLPEEVGPFCDAFERTGAVLERSREYPNRGSRRVRVYMDVEVPCEDGWKFSTQLENRPKIG